MSYSIYIGERVLREEDDDAWYTVRETESADAPTFPGDDMTRNTNGRHPAYSAWDGFTRETGLYDLFFDKAAGLMRDHPGCVKLTDRHRKAIDAALVAWSVAHPGSVPGWCECAVCAGPFGKATPHVERDGQLARLVWLAWWVTWALKNCKVPALANS